MTHSCFSDSFIRSSFLPFAYLSELQLMVQVMTQRIITSLSLLYSQCCRSMLDSLNYPQGSGCGTYAQDPPFDQVFAGSKPTRCVSMQFLRAKHSILILFKSGKQIILDFLEVIMGPELTAVK